MGIEMARYDLVIRDGTIADGTGNPLREADVAVLDGKIAAVGIIAGGGREEVDARGLLVTPGFVDVHTHYDGHLTWTESLDPSSGNGVTTVVTGNCGVGFAPCLPQHREGLIRLMEGVEDIPEVVMAEGLPWDWESFPAFLDAAERRPHDIDFAVLLPHAPLRVFVMGKRAFDLEPATEANRASMRQLARQAVEAGAIGFSTSRSISHRASDGSYIPSMRAEEAELREIALGLADAGRGVLQGIAAAGDQKIEHYEFLHRIALQSGRPLSYTVTQLDSDKNLWRRIFELIERDRAAGADIKAQIFNRPIGVVLGLAGSFNPFSMHPFYIEHLEKLPLAQRVAEMRKPEVRANIVQPDGVMNHPFGHTMRRFNQMFRFGDSACYEPDTQTSVGAIAAARGVSPDEIAYDMLLEQDGHAMLLVAAANYADGNLDTALEMMRREQSILGLGDGGAHLGFVCDASYTTFTLTHWARDRANGERLGIAEAVRMLTSDPARSHRFHDRGRIAPGLKADINIIDMNRLKLFSPSVVHDLPGGAKRLTQRAEGYVATYVSGIAVRREGRDTGARPGRLVREAGI
jgi:N-acyl-D-amino-acid deacylase